MEHLPEVGDTNGGTIFGLGSVDAKVPGEQPSDRFAKLEELQGSRDRFNTLVTYSCLQKPSGSQNLRSEPVVLASKLPPLTSPAQPLPLWAPRPLKISLMNQSCVAHLVGNPRPHHANGGILVIHFTRSCLRSLTQQADPDSWHGKHPISPDLSLALIFFWARLNQFKLQFGRSTRKTGP